MPKKVPDETLVQEIKYYRQWRPPTLKQYLVRRTVKETMTDVTKGVTINPDTGYPVPKSAFKVKESVGGLSSEKIAAEHPEWVEDWQKEYGGVFRAPPIRRPK